MDAAADATATAAAMAAASAAELLEHAKRLAPIHRYRASSEQLEAAAKRAEGAPTLYVEAVSLFNDCLGTDSAGHGVVERAAASHIVVR